ncbi:hypothetical protein ACQ4PT_030446 [Festuca glaucescens]
MAAPPPVLTLAVEKGPRKGETRQCAAGSALRVGRVVKGNHLAVRDVGASQQHLAIEFLPPPAARWAVSDLGSSNGSFLNGAPLAPNVPTPLSDGDSIKIGESTVLAVSISSDLDLNAATAADPEPRRSSRYTAATEEEKPPAVTRRGARKKAVVAEIPVENEVPDAAVVVLEEEKARPVTRRGGRGKAAAAVPAEETEEVVELRRHGGRKKAEQPPELEKEEGEKEPPVATRRGGRKKAEQPPEQEKEKGAKEAPVATRRGGRKKAVEPPELEKGEVKEEGPVATHGGRRKKAAEPAEFEKEEEEEAVVVTRRGGQNKTTEPPEPEKEEEVEALVVTRGRRKNNAVPVAPPPQPPKTRSGRGQGRVARTTSTRSTVLEDEEVEEEEENEAAAQRELPGNLAASTAVKDGEEEKGDKVAAEDVEIEVAAKTLEEEVPNGRVSAQCAVSDIVGDEEKGGGAEEDDGEGRVTRTTSTRSTVLDDEEVEEDEENEVAAQRELPGNLSTSTAVKDGEEGKGDKAAAGDVEIEAVPKTLEEEVLKGRGSAQCGASDNVGDEEMGGGAEEDDDIVGLVGSGGELGDGVKVKRAGRSSLETMTLGEWFDRMEIYLPRTINETADKMIAELEEKQKRIHEYIATLGNSSNPY